VGFSPARVELDAEDPALCELVARLPPDLVPGAGLRCDVKLIGPAQLAANGTRSCAGQTPLVVIVPDDAPRELVRECFRGGARDVLTLSEARRGLAPALRRVIEQPDASALEQLQQSYDQTLEALVSALDLREQETADHSVRVALYALRLGLRLRVPGAALRDLYHGALLHDLGKIGIPDQVLLKPGSLSSAEWQVMRTHPQLGSEILAGISFLSPARDVPLCHHEAWDGSGYPAGLGGRDIPLHARIFAVVDTYDALRSERPYKRAHSHAESVALLREAAGSRLDPELVESFAAEPAGTWARLAARARGERGFRAALADARAAEP
jgi:HD-GYP domain-containing protein (c-di-GMP phosphodiesterase class II)